MMKVYKVITILFYLFVSNSYGFANSLNNKRNTKNNVNNNSTANSNKKHVVAHMNVASLSNSIFTTGTKSLITASAASKAVPAAASATGAAIFAKVLGYIMALGSMTVYTPILIHLLKEKSSEGLSIQTWIFNIIGLTLSVSYPIQKKYMLNTYLELVILSLQSVMIFGIICHYNNLDKQFLLSLIPYSLYTAVIVTKQFPNHILQPMLIIASLVCNYANVPQILLTYQTKKAVWSRTTALLSFAGNLVRIFTTLQLTKDYFFLFGFSLGAITNGILLLQTFIYPSK